MLGMRYLMDVISLDATLVQRLARPAHGPAEDGPLFITSETGPAARGAGCGDRREGR